MMPGQAQRILVALWLVCLSGCSFFFGVFSARECTEAESPDTCQGDILVVCRNEQRFEIDCAAGGTSCDPEHGVCTVCGDGITSPTEECDDGNNISDDGCNAGCLLERCGDGVLQTIEACDDGNTLDGDGCSGLCRQETCGDGILQTTLGEECDDGNTTNGDGCDEDCSPSGCGNGIVGGGEECDPPLAGVCNQACLRVAACGNGVVEAPEECDDGNLQNGDACSQSCRFDPFPERVRDFGALTDDIAIQGFLFLPIEIDDYTISNPSATAMEVRIDVLDPFLRSRSCGPEPSLPGETFVLQAFNGAGDVLAQSTERSQTDYCPGISVNLAPGGVAFVRLTVAPESQALLRYLLVFDFEANSGGCGNGVLEAAEQCDPPRGGSCSVECQALPFCGDGVVAPLETCDDGGLLSGDGCSATCQSESLFLEVEPNEDGSPNPGTSPITLDGNDFSIVNANDPITSDAVIAGQLSPSGDEDVFAIQNSGSAPIHVRLDVFDAVRGLGIPCVFLNSLLDTVLNIRNAAGGLLVNNEDRSAGDLCSGLEIVLSAQETVFVQILDFGDDQVSSTYLLNVDFITCGDGARAFGEECDQPGDPSCDASCQRVAVCGDARLDAPETCEDANAVAGDGCDEDCQAEGLPIVSETEPNHDSTPSVGITFNQSLQEALSGQDFLASAAEGPFTEDVLISASLVSAGPSTAGDEDVFAVQNTGASFVRLQLETFDPVLGVGEPCGDFFSDAIDTVINVRDDAGAILFQNDNKGSLDTCSKLSVVLGGNQTVFVHVIEFGDNEVVPGYLLRVLFESFIVCGDGFVEFPEECEPPNTASCDASCRLVANCGNGFLESAEECDDLNALSGDGCSATCQEELGFVCESPSEQPSVCFHPFTESEPNDDGAINQNGGATNGNDFSAANADGPFSVAGGDVLVSAALAVAGDEDVFSITNPGPGPVVVVAETFDSTGIAACLGLDTEITLRNNAGTELANDDDNGIERCSLLVFTINPNQTLFVHIISFGDNSPIQAYRLALRFLVCGDGLWQLPEQCDDGNAQSGDGCSSTCVAEVNLTESEPNEDGSPNPSNNSTNGDDFSSANADGPFDTAEGDVLLSASIGVPGDEDVFALTNTGVAPVSIKAESFQTLGTCPATVDTEITLRDAAGTELANNDDGGIGRCSRLVFTLNPNQTLFLHVIAFGDGSIIPAYVLAIDVL